MSFNLATALEMPTNGYINNGFHENPALLISAKPILIDEDRVDGKWMRNVNVEVANNISKINGHFKAAVTVRNAVKSYSSAGPPILKGLSMNVQKGTIYSLLGSSGCGKTTLLSCIVGIKHLNSGEILVFGAKPGTKGCGIPGCLVGYMPQDSALYSEFSINEMARYFGTLYGMTTEQIISSQDALIKVLHLPDAKTRISSLSGGTKRRVSLAISLIHSPQLLVLDEPTVGTDPLLRESIWRYLCDLVSSQQTTVIITTHYINEAQRSNTVGLMRDGVLLKEESPGKLLTEFNTPMLEEVVLRLCQNNIGQDNPNIANDQSNVFEEPTLYYGTEESNNNATFVSPLNRVAALIVKNAVVYSRNLAMLAFMLVLPGIQLVLMCFALGGDPKLINVGVVNHELSQFQRCPLHNFTREGCDLELLSCQYLSKIPSDKIILRDYENEDLAREAVKRGDSYGFMIFPAGFSDSVYMKSVASNVVDNETLKGSQILLQRDLSNKQISLSLKRIFYDVYSEFVKELLANCGFQSELGESPIKDVNPIYGSDDADFKQFLSPPVLLSVIFFFPLITTSVFFIWDKKQGTLERSRVAGVKTWEIMTSFFVTETFIFLIQIAIAILIIIHVFGINIQGSLSLFICLAILMGLSGVSMGFLLASFCNEEIEAILIAMGSYFPNFMISGIMWPTEGMPTVLQYAGYFLPCTSAGESARSIINRGWGFLHHRVWPGFAIPFGWICIYCIVTVYIHKKVLAKK